ncbi:MAG: enoyl-CoA hydratase/isomerase family protein [Nannocystaceae bacterium]
MHEIVLQSPNLGALSRATIDALRDELRRAAGTPLLLRGDGPAFSAGLDLREIQAMDRAAMITFLTALDDLVLELYTYPGPTVAWVNGHAIAGGCILALCCDHRVAVHRPSVKIGLSEVALGVAFPPAPLAVVQARVARQSVDEVVLGARLYSPGEALARGLVDELAADEGERARACLETLAASPRDGYAIAKSMLRARIRRQAEAEREQFFADHLERWLGPELRQRIDARLRKR